MHKQARIFFVLMVSATASIVNFAFFPQGQINLQADIDKFLTRCNNCGSALYSDSAAFNSLAGDNIHSIWTVERVGNQVTIKSDNGKYLSICVNCWNHSAYPEAVFVLATSSSDPLALWTPEDQGNGKWALKGNNGKYLSRCQNCVLDGSYSNFAFARVTSLENKSNALWTPIRVFPNGKVNILNDMGAFLTRCNTCGSALYYDSAAFTSTDPNVSYAIWDVEKIGSKVAFKSDSGKYLSLCQNCWNNSVYTEGVFVEATSSSDSIALWTPEDIGNGKWALMGDNGKYLSRCQNCVLDGSYSNFAFARVTSLQNKPNAQWIITLRT